MRILFWIDTHSSAISSLELVFRVCCSILWFIPSLWPIRCCSGLSLFMQTIYNEFLCFLLQRYNTLSFVPVGCAGHGFKLSPVVGKLLCELALDLPPSHDLTPFRLDRFNKEQQP